MANANVSRLGQVNQQGNVREMFLKIFAGEVLTAFERHNQFLGLTNVRTITHGKSAMFPLVGRIGAEYHQVGTEITGMNVNHAERVITIDDLLISHAFIADIDEAMNHFEVRSKYSTEMGRKLATTMDQNILKEIVRSARSASLLADLDAPGGIELKNDKFKRGAGGAANLEEHTGALAEAIYAMAQRLDENDIPSDGRYVAFRPNEYYALAQNLDLINSLYGGTGSVREGDIVKVAGITILKTNNLPSLDDTNDDTYHGIDASQTIGVGFLEDAVGTVKLLDLSMQSEWDIRRQGTLMVARYAVGHAPLRPECAVEFKLDSLTN